MRTRVSRVKRKARINVVEKFKFIGVLEIDDRMRQLDRAYGRLQMSGSREGKVVQVVALTGEVNKWL
jgi:hypothetical protein